MLCYENPIALFRSPTKEGNWVNSCICFLILGILYWLFHIVVWVLPFFIYNTLYFFKFIFFLIVIVFRELNNNKKFFEVYYICRQIDGLLKITMRPQDHIYISRIYKLKIYTCSVYLSILKDAKSIKTCIECSNSDIDLYLCSPWKKYTLK